MHNLLDIRNLHKLGDVCQKHRGTLYAFGGTATRLAIALRERKISQEQVRQSQTDERPIDLFDVAPFTGDIDLSHDGKPDATPAICASILESVPAAEAFRWQVASVDERGEELAARKCNNIIPARLMSLSSVANSDFLTLGMVFRMSTLTSTGTSATASTRTLPSIEAAETSKSSRPYFSSRLFSRHAWMFGGSRNQDTGTSKKSLTRLLMAWNSPMR